MGETVTVGGVGIAPEHMERFWASVRIEPDGCWRWTKAVTGRPGREYGVFAAQGQTFRANRVALASRVPEPPGGAWALHDCDVTWCVNPDHLHWGDHADNMREAAERGLSRPGLRAGTHCPKGHEYTPENTVVRNRKGVHGKTYAVQTCRTCNLAASRAYKERNRDHMANYRAAYKAANRQKFRDYEQQRRERLKRESNK